MEAAPSGRTPFSSSRDVFTPTMPDWAEAIPTERLPRLRRLGRANPMGIAARLWREGDEAVCQVTLGEAFEGAPGRAHGGVVAALIDETMGLVSRSPRTPAFTGRLTVTYRAPTPIGQPLEVRSRLRPLGPQADHHRPS